MSFDNAGGGGRIFLFAGVRGGCLICCGGVIDSSEEMEMLVQCCVFSVIFIVGKKGMLDKNATRFRIEESLVLSIMHIYWFI